MAMSKQDKNFLINFSPLLLVALVMLFILCAQEANGETATQNYESNILKELPLELINEGKTS
jgi:hypothetical protein|tara:strand:+ start:1394 stop:1579 length:186 start_codon:yes stop_codon:yes gene_type:complete